MTGQLVDVGGTRVHVDLRGHYDAPPLLFVHGGPGMGAYEFMAVQGPRLATDLLVIGVDQRGVLRSDPLPRGSVLDVASIVDDFETLRKYLGLEEWSLLAHSAGAMYAAEYALREPDVVTSVIYDCPALDGDAADRERLRIVARMARARGDVAGADACEGLAAKETRLTASDDAIGLSRSTAGDAWDALYFADPNRAAILPALQEESGLSAEQWGRGASHAPLRDQLYVDRVPLVEQAEQPVLLVRGHVDFACPPPVVDRLVEAGADLHTFEASAHFPFLEEPDAYADVVRDFVAYDGE